MNHPKVELHFLKPQQLQAMQEKAQSMRHERYRKPDCHLKITVIVLFLWLMNYFQACTVQVPFNKTL